MNIIPLINQFFELSHKLQLEHADKYDRNLNRIQNFFENNGYVIQNPLSEKYNETRTDVDATIVGKNTQNLKITQVIKPVIYKNLDGQLTLVQKGIVVAE